MNAPVALTLASAVANIGGGYVAKLPGRHVLQDKKPSEEGADLLAASALEKALPGIGALVARAVVGAFDEMTKAGKAPAFHSEDARNRKEYIDDLAREHVGDERMERRAEAEGRDAEQQARGFNPRSASRLERRASRSRVERDAPGMQIAEFIGWMAGVGNGDPERAFRAAKKGGGSRDVVRALGETNFAAGGALIPENMWGDFIELLYNTSVYLQAGPTRMNVVNGNLVLPKLATGASASWIGESDNAPASSQTFGQVRIDLRKLAVLTAAANEFLRDSSVNAIELIRSDLAANAAVAVDAAALRSLGTSFQPRGLRGWVPSSQQTAQTGTTVAAITSDLMTVMRFLEDARIVSQRLAWFASPRTKFGLMGKRDGNNNEVWAAELRQGSLYGAKFFSTQNIPTNVGTGSVCSETYLVAMDHQIYAEEAGGQTVAVVDGAAYHDGSAVVAGFSRDESAVRLVQRLDIVSRQNGAEIAQIFDVTVA